MTNGRIASQAPADAEKLLADLTALATYRAGLLRAATFARSLRENAARSALVPPKETRESLRNAWRSFMDYVLALDSMGRFYQVFRDIAPEPQREPAFLAFYAVFLAQYRCALEFMDAADGILGAEFVLNDGDIEAGLPAGTYDTLRSRFLNVARAAEFAWYEGVYRTIGCGAHPETRQAIAEDAAAIWRMGQGRGETLTAKNAWDVVKKAALSAWFPVQAGVSEWMGQIKVQREGQTLVTLEQIGRAREGLWPGDILLERREWYLSNIGLPGFWCHAALYVGTPAERRNFFRDDETAAWVRSQGEESGDMEDLLASRDPRAHAASLEPREEGRSSRVLEAIRPGVVFTSIEHSAKADSLAVLRPKLPRMEKARALLSAFRYVGRPYDFDFDFRTDSALVCSELVFKAYEPSRGYRGLRLPLSEIAGRPVCPPNDIARLFDTEAGSDEKQLDLVLFLDGNEAAGKSVEAGEEVFRQSWKRPKWHVFAQEAPPVR